MGFAEVGRGCVKNYREYNRALGFFVVAVEEAFSFRQDWHQDDRAKPVIREYQFALDSVLQSHPELQPCAVHCCYCGIRFFTHPRSAGRGDLRCPFGCRQHHRRQASRQRSTAYYQTAVGRRKKKRLNAYRSVGGRSPGGPQQPEPDPPSVPCSEPPREELRELVERRREGVVLDEWRLATTPMLPYLRMVVRLIEGFWLPGQELVRWLREALRQHRIATDESTLYVLRFRSPHPP